MAGVMDGGQDYCRELETYLCRKNDGHLIRIVGPAFEQVCGWAERGIPLKLAMRGIDRYFERYYSKGPRRRPVRIEFCEADVLDVFDEWRRAVGVGASASGSGIRDPGSDASDPAGPRSSLPAHLERVIARLTAHRAGSDRSLDAVLDDLVRELDAARAKSKGVRGDARDALIDRLQQLDGSLVEALRRQLDDRALQRLSEEADEELKPFRARMPADAYRQSHQACVDRLLRERAGLPTISYE
ncbi:MAG TPA: hypothetical protein VN654_11615 [Vicinamibacterales bacterium]|nr:hypothetical protein [Vicinamibacterales bacterium]